ncbi:hypothetical protein Sru01_28470 [Sphaerisporangium rufum]|uniref:Uncharacterized protein n=1 Tax=Sphaerisporangium rufum TaxID=1381558 RepID=A0A919V527_9ACTN|nr:hypothetical protein Sru01_28470 [Sphaerisporangium rufum]
MVACETIHKHTSQPDLAANRPWAKVWNILTFGPDRQEIFRGTPVDQRTVTDITSTGRSGPLFGTYPGSAPGQSRAASSAARANTWSSIASVTRPVKVFCWLGW